MMGGPLQSKLVHLLKQQEFSVSRIPNRMQMHAMLSSMPLSLYFKSSLAQHLILVFAQQLQDSLQQNGCTILKQCLLFCFVGNV